MRRSGAPGREGTVIASTGEDGRGRRARLALTAGGALPLLAAAWLRTPAVPYVAGLAVATIALGVLTWRWPAVGAWRAAALGAAGMAFVVLAGSTQARLAALRGGWESDELASRRAAAAALEPALRRAEQELARAVEAALAAPAGEARAFAALAPLTGGPGDRAVLLERWPADGDAAGARPLAWAGRVRVLPGRETAGTRVVETPFYTLLAVTGRAEDRRATATLVLDAAPPADRLAAPFAATLPLGAARPFAYTVVAADREPAGDTAAPAARLPLADGRALQAVPASLGAAEAELRVLERARVVGLVALAVLVAAFVLFAWAPFGGLGRGAVLATGLAAVGLVPFSAASNATRLLDPTVYFARIGGPWTASVGTLGLTGALVLLAVLTLQRRLPALRARASALALLAGLAVGAPFLLRELARGIQAPAGPVSTGLWVAYQVALCLAGVALLVLVSVAGRAFAPRGREVPLWLGPLVAALAALAAPLLWTGPGRWPVWFAGWWVLAIVLLALARRARGRLLAATTVAGLGAAVLVWGALARGHAEQALREVARLDAADPAAVQLLERIAEELAAAPAPGDAEALLRAYVASDLAATDFPVVLTAWDAAGRVRDSLALWDTGDGARFAAALADTARATGQAVLATRTGAIGTRLVLAVPHASGGATSVVVAPESRFFPPDPYLALYGLRRAPGGDPGYAVSVAPSAAGEAPSRPRWARVGDDLHADWVAPIGARGRRVHVVVALRGLDGLIPRGSLLLLVDLAVVAALWALSAVGDGTVARWLRVRRRRWARSYRVRLSLVLFGFFVVPALGFALWTWRQLGTDARESRELLVREVLRGAAADVEPEARPADDVAPGAPTAAEARRRGLLDAERAGAPLFLFEDGVLRDVSSPLLASLAPGGVLLPPAAWLALDAAGEPFAAVSRPVGERAVLFGFRPFALGGGTAVLAAPAPSDDLALGRRGEDVLVLVLFATALGALAALWLSGLAAREFARPIGALRRAALAVARGEAEPALPALPPSEFLPVFLAFRRMDADLRASRQALEAAQRRIATVLRTVASGVIAVRGDGVVTVANPAAESLFGAPIPAGAPLAAGAAAALGAPLAGFLPGARDEEELDLVVEGRQVHARLSRLSGAAGGAVITLDDVTELARAQRVLAWGEMARQVAHEIKNPLTPIRLGVQHLRRAYRDGRGDFGGVLEQNVGRILAEIDHLDEIARAFSRYGTLPDERPAPVATDVGAVARDVIELERLGEQGVAWVLDAPDAAVPALARGDELREVLLNLLENARLASARRVELRVLPPGDGRAGAGPAPGGLAPVRLVVVDDGHGIPAAVLPRVFEPHFSTRTSGSGLGLAISRQLVEGWGGTILVESTEGVGTTVTVALAAASTPWQLEASREPRA